MVAVAVQARADARRAAQGPPLHEILAPVALADFRAWAARTPADQQWKAWLDGRHPLADLPSWKGITADMDDDTARQIYETISFRL